MENHLKKLVEVRLKLLGVAGTKAATDSGLGRTFINDILHERKRTVRADAVDRLATALRLAPEEIALAQRGIWLDRWESVSERLGEQALQEPLAIAQSAAGRANPADVPLIGLAMGAIVQNNITGFKLSEKPIDFVKRPPALANSVDVYAILVSGDSMAPMHPSGELRFVNPHRPANAGDTVIVRTKLWDAAPEQAYIKVLRRRTPNHIVLEQLNPSATIEIPLSVIDGVHRVLTTRELFGV